MSGEIQVMLDELRATARRIAEMQDEQDIVIDQRDRLILWLVDAGLTYREVGEAAGITGSRVEQIVRACDSAEAP